MKNVKKRPNPEVIDRITKFLLGLQANSDNPEKLNITELKQKFKISTYAVNTVLRDIGFIEGDQFDFKLTVEPTKENAIVFWKASRDYAYGVKQKKLAETPGFKDKILLPTKEMEKAIYDNECYIVRFGKNDKGFVTKFNFMNTNEMQEAVQKSNDLKIPFKVFTLKVMFDFQY